LRARSRTLRHPRGNEVKTPLLVPSFSSKGFDVVQRSGKSKTLRSEASQYLDFFSHRLNETFLVSAYDLHNGLLDQAPRFNSKHSTSVFSLPEILFLDSGLYEWRTGSDAGEPVQEVRLPTDWNQAMHTEFLKQVPPDANNLAIVSWDSYGGYLRQIKQAQAFFASYPGAMSVFLLKPVSGSPSSKHRYYDIGKLTPHAERLAAFDVIGVTEKELGKSVLDRAATVARLRDLLDAKEVDAPIHIFGGLDPLYSPLYFAAGAEIFDGLTWLRYAFIDGVAVHRDSLPILYRRLDMDSELRTLTAQTNNLDVMQDLARQMKRFVRTKDWKLFGERAAVLEDAYLGMESEL
jgi:hypothetical protein